MLKLLLSVNIDYVATVINAQETQYTDPVHTAFLVEEQGGQIGSSPSICVKIATILLIVTLNYFTKHYKSK